MQVLGRRESVEVSISVGTARAALPNVRINMPFWQVYESV